MYKQDLTLKNLQGLYAICTVNFTSVVEEDPKDPFSIATTSRCRGGRYSFPCIAPFNL